MAKATKTTTTKATKTAKAADPTKPTVTVSAGKQVPFDAKANAAAIKEERAARARGEELKLERYTVNDGQSVRKNGERYMAGEAIDLTAADGERLVAKGTVTKGGKAKAKDDPDAGNGTGGQLPISQSTGTIGEGAETDPDSDAAQAQREADEAAAAAADQAQQDAGLPSGAENR